MAAVLSAVVVGAAPGDVADSVAVLEARHTALLATAVVESIVTVVFAALGPDQAVVVVVVAASPAPCM